MAPFTLLIGHVDDIDATPLADWLPGCEWSGQWPRHESGNHSTELTVGRTDVDHALLTLVAAGWKQLAPQNIYT